MNLPFKIARRYLFAKKSQNIINVVSMISVIGIAISTMAMIIVLSGFNGIEKVVEDLYNTFDPDIKITLNEGKTFRKNELQSTEIFELDGVSYGSEVIEQTVILEKGEKFEACKIKGVRADYIFNTSLDTLLTEGLPDLEYEGISFCIPGAILQSRLGFTSDPRYDNQITINGMLRDKKISMTSQPFNQKKITVGGVFMTGLMTNDGKYVFSSLEFAENLLGYQDEITGLEVFAKDLSKSQLYRLKSKIEGLVGDKFKVQTREEQNALIFSATKSEKIAVFIILCFVMIIAAFSLIASLTMLILEKRKDVFTLYSIGFTKKDVRNLFFYEGVLINILGGLIGLILGLLICYLQIWFGIVPIQESIMESYPIEVEFMDIIYILITVISVGLLSSYFPVKYLVKRLEI
ncbi:MAG: lipoprotein-releasing system permease protein [Urechidicola sp.]